MTFTQCWKELAEKGLVLLKKNEFGEYGVNFNYQLGIGREKWLETEYNSDDFHDCFSTGLDMWKRNNVLCLERGFPVGTSPFLMEAK